MDSIQVQTFGKFEITYNGEVVNLERSHSTKTAHLLQYLMVHADRAFEKEALVGILYEEDEVTDPLNNLKVNVFRLRRMLAASKLPGEKFILHKRGCYSWNQDVPFEIDLDQYRKLTDHAARSDLPMADKAALMLAAIELYKGEFLPSLRGEEWVALIDAECQERYLRAVEFVVDYYRQTENFEREKAILEQAAVYFPYEERIREMQLRCLLEHKMFREAMELYDEVTKRMMDDLGIVPSEEMSQLHQVLVGEMDMPIATFQDIRSDICENGEIAGAYNCSYLAFIDASRLIARYVQRSGQSAYFVLCTLVSGSGSPLPAGSKLRDAAASVNRAVRSSLRRGDLYTRYGPSQFLMLLMGINRDNCKIVSKRIDQKFALEPASRGLKLRWEFEPISSVIPAE